MSKGASALFVEAVGVDVSRLLQPREFIESRNDADAMTAENWMGTRLSWCYGGTMLDCCLRSLFRSDGV